MENQDLYRVHAVRKGAEARITAIIIDHWEQVRGDRRFPSQQDLDPNYLEPYLDSCFLIKVEELMHTGKHNYVYIGKNILEAYGSSATHAQNEGVDPLSHKDKFEEVLKRRLPVLDEGEFMNQDGRIVRYRQCLVPLGNNGVVESIFGGMRFKVF